MPFVKLDCGILNSTLWFDRQARDVFITALLMAEPYELLEPIQQIHVDSLEYTGWLVPAGWYGFVPAAGVGITHRAGIEESEGREALRVLGSPENSSRTPDYEGRRLVRINGGYLVLNFIKYREKDASAADRQRRWRERQKAKAKGKPSRVTESPLRVISNQAEAEAEAEVQQLAPLAVTPPAKTTAKPLAYRPRIDVAWPGRPNVPGSLHAELGRNSAATPRRPTRGCTPGIPSRLHHSRTSPSGTMTSASGGPGSGSGWAQLRSRRALPRARPRRRSIMTRTGATTTRPAAPVTGTP